jgi:hypothetical protein
MLNEKVTPFTAAGRLSDARLPVDPAIAEQQKLVSEVEVTSLQIEQDPDIGSDPYNCTGQYCIVDIVKDR